MNILYLSDILNVHDERLMAQFKEAGHEMTLLTFFHRAPELPGFAKEHKVIHEKYEYYPDGAGASRWRLIRAVEYKRDEARACLKLKDVIRLGRFHAVFANWALTSGYIAAHAAAKPLVLFPWGSDILVWPRLHKGFSMRATKALRSSDLVICNSRTCADAAVRLGRLRPETVEVLPIELDPERFEPRERNNALREEWGVGDRTLILSTRPLKELYDHPTLMAALAKPEFEKFFLTFVGDGNLREDLEKKAKDLEISDRVKFVGAVPNEKVPEYLAAADLYITCSRSDSASLGLLEAMAMGIPVVASDIPPNREWIADGQSGWLFPVGKQEDLAKALLRATEDPKNLEEVAMRGRAIALARADARKNFPKLIERIEGLVTARRNR